MHNDVIQTKGKSIGFVFPCHALTIPVAVKHFLKKIDPKSSEYFFAVVTRYGTVFKGFDKIIKLLNKKNKIINSQFIINMCHNEAPRSNKNYIVPSESDIKNIEKSTIKNIDLISSTIANQYSIIEKDTTVLAKTSSNTISSVLIENFVVFLMDLSEYIGGVNYFYHDDECNGCGVCEKVCLSKKIKIVEKKPVWQKNVLCYMCYACLNYCPRQSVQIKNIPYVKSYTTNNPRYPHPYATANEISAQKERHS